MSGKEPSTEKKGRRPAVEKKEYKGKAIAADRGRPAFNVSEVKNAVKNMTL